MNKLYILGGPPRTAKTMIMSDLAKEKGIAIITADAVIHGIRNVLTGEPHQMLKDIELNGSAEWKASISSGGKRKPFSVNGTETELTLQAFIGMLDYYRRNNESVAFEGTAFTPEWVNNLKIGEFTIRAAFVGFTDSEHSNQILAFAKANPHDWINTWLIQDDGDETKIRKWVAEQSYRSVELKAQAEDFGFPFFDISTMPFEQYITSAQQYFLEL